MRSVGNASLSRPSCSNAKRRADLGRGIRGRLRQQQLKLSERRLRSAALQKQLRVLRAQLDIERIGHRERSSSSREPDMLGNPQISLRRIWGPTQL